MLKTLTITLILLLLGACSSPTGNVSAAHTAINLQSDRRSFGTILDDNTLYLKLYDAIYQGENTELKDAHLNFLTYESKVLITGEVAQESHKTLINNLITERVPQVVEIINETQISPTSSILSRAKDTFITTGIKALFYNQDVFHPAHVRLTTENQSVYLMGKVTKREAKEAVRIAKQVSGVKQIIKVFEYLNSRPIAEIKAQERRELEAKRQIEIDAQKQELEQQKSLIRQQERQIQEQIDKLSNSPTSGTRF
ncbi:MAG: BON domain-containing protein [Candidatus Thioglobus sp.]|nr:BON domain-containing protein [Candidatus Thioglobus sp.]